MIQEGGHVSVPKLGSRRTPPVDTPLCWVECMFGWASETRILQFYWWPRQWVFLPPLIHGPPWHSLFTKKKCNKGKAGEQEHN